MKNKNFSYVVHQIYRCATFVDEKKNRNVKIALTVERSFCGVSCDERIPKLVHFTYDKSKQSNTNFINVTLVHHINTPSFSIIIIHHHCTAADQAKKYYFFSRSFQLQHELGVSVPQQKKNISIVVGGSGLVLHFGCEKFDNSKHGADDH